MLSERLRPQNISELVGNEHARLQLVKWLKNWKVSSKPILLMGPPGVGKSTSIHAVAKEFGYTVIEYNASDVRTREGLRAALGPVLENTSLFGEREKLLIFLDEVDGLSGRSDYAGNEYILEFIQDSAIPVAMAANVEDDLKLKKLAQKSLVIRFMPVNKQMLLIYLKSVVRRETLKVEVETLRQIAAESKGDVRFALNLLQTVSGETVLGALADKQFFSDSQALDSVLESQDLGQALLRLRQYDVRPYDKVRSIFDSVVSAKNLSIEEKSKALDLVAEADLLLGKIGREQNWRLLRYLDKYLASATLLRHLKRTDSSLPWPVKLAIWNDGRVTKKLQEVLSPRYHVGRSDLATLYLPYFSYFFSKSPKELETFASAFSLGESDKRVLLKMASR